MSNLIYRRWKQYFQIPSAESVESLSPSAYRYFGFLCREMNVHSAVELRCSIAEIAQATSIRDHKTISGARRELQAARLIEVHKVPPGVYAHVMLDQSGDPIPAPKDRKGIRHYSAKTAKKARERRINPAPRREFDVTTSSPAISTAEAPLMRQCHTHGLVAHWKRGEGWVCQSCHPNPYPSERWQPPTAGEIGFK
jgi:hypothetical protein